MQFEHGDILSHLTFLLLHVTHVRGLRAPGPCAAESGLFSAELSCAVSANMAHAAESRYKRGPFVKGGMMTNIDSR